MAIKVKKSSENSANVEELLWRTADKLRGHIEASSYKNVVLELVYLKFLSDEFSAYSDKLTNQGIDPDDKKNYSLPQQLWLPPEARWRYLLSHADKPSIAYMVDHAMTLIEQEYPFLEGIILKGIVDLHVDTSIIRELLQLVDTMNQSAWDTSSQDTLGRVYEYFLGKFARLAEKGGEFYTPPSIIKLLVSMMKPMKGSIYDPCCGTGGMFIQSQKYVMTHGSKSDDISLYGQEINPTTWKLCKMNLSIHGMNGDIGTMPSDTFINDMHPTLKADFILANPPFNVSEWGREKLLNDSRWKFGIPLANNANYAWIQHIIDHLAADGIAGFVLTNGSLSTNVGRVEGMIRKAIIASDLVECIISLPSQLFYNTQISTCLWLLTKDKTNRKYRDRTGKTLFIYAGTMGIQIDRTHRELSADEIIRITETYDNWKSHSWNQSYNDIVGFCKEASIEDIMSHKWSLVPGRYVGFESHSAIPGWDIEQLEHEIAELESQIIAFGKLSETALQVLKELVHD